MARIYPSECFIDITPVGNMIYADMKAKGSETVIPSVDKLKKEKVMIDGYESTFYFLPGKWDEILRRIRDGNR